MEEKRLTDNQKKRIADIKELWFKELDGLHDVDLDSNSLSNKSNHERRELEKKYLPQIQAIYNE